MLIMTKNTMGTKLPRKLEQKMQIVGEQIKLARLRRNLSVAQVAERATCSPLTVSRMVAKYSKNKVQANNRNWIGYPQPKHCHSSRENRPDSATLRLLFSSGLLKILVSLKFSKEKNDHKPSLSVVVITNNESKIRKLCMPITSKSTGSFPVREYV